MTYKSLMTVIRERNIKENNSQYRSLNNAIRSIYNRQLTPQTDEPTDQEKQQIQNRKIQNKLKVIDNP